MADMASPIPQPNAAPEAMIYETQNQDIELSQSFQPSFSNNGNKAMVSNIFDSNDDGLCFSSGMIITEQKEMDYQHHGIVPPDDEDHDFMHPITPSAPQEMILGMDSAPNTIPQPQTVPLPANPPPNQQNDGTNMRQKLIGIKQNISNRISRRINNFGNNNARNRKFGNTNTNTRNRKFRGLNTRNGNKIGKSRAMPYKMKQSRPFRDQSRSRTPSMSISLSHHSHTHTPTYTHTYNSHHHRTQINKASPSPAVHSRSHPRQKGSGVRMYKGPRMHTPSISHNESHGNNNSTFSYDATRKYSNTLTVKSNVMIEHQDTSSYNMYSPTMSNYPSVDQEPETSTTFIHESSTTQNNDNLVYTDNEPSAFGKEQDQQPSPYNFGFHNINNTEF